MGLQARHTNQKSRLLNKNESKAACTHRHKVGSTSTCSIWMIQVHTDPWHLTECDNPARRHSMAQTAMSSSWDTKSAHSQLAPGYGCNTHLDVFINIVHSRYVWSPITDHQVRFCTTLETAATTLQNDQNCERKCK